MREEETIDRIKALTEKFERTMPGFRERISFEPLEAIPKRPQKGQLTVDATEILILSEIHAVFRNIPDREAAWDRLSPWAKDVLQNLHDLELKNVRF